LITNRTLIAMFQLLKRRDSRFRVTPGTTLKNDLTGEVVYIPPQDGREIEAAMAALERFINIDELSPLDPLIRMALIHHQFESIHPFPDGNGRIGRILNVLYLTRSGLLEIPVLYLSRHISRTKAEYYRLLQGVRTSGDWEAWVLYILAAVAETAQTTLVLVEGVRSQMASVKKRLRADLPAIYSQDLLNNLFRHPYTRIEFVEKDLAVTRQTAAKYLDRLATHGFVTKQRSGRSNYYVSTALVRLFLDLSGTP
jgi:Fic family protein